jgi:hypothetical protein
LPFILRVRFANINLKKIGAIFVVFIKFYQVADPATKWRSSVAAENQDERPCSDAIAQMKCGDAIECVKFRVTSTVANAQIAAVHIGKGIANKSVNIPGTAGDEAEKYEGECQEKSQTNGGPFQNASWPLCAHRFPLFRFDFQ